MAEERVERRLTAILAADVAGYSRLMGADEEGTLAALKVLRREVADPKRCRSPESWQELAYRRPTCDPALSPHSPDEAAILSALTAVRD